MNDLPIRLLFLTHLASTLFMTGVIWFVQCVHYPLFASVGEEGFRNFEERHSFLTTWIVAPPMFLEAATALLLFWFRPAGMPTWQIVTGLAFVVVNWLSTALLQVPEHKRLAGGYNRTAQERLVLTNWIRTAGWSFRAILVLWMTENLMSSANQ
jgi:hypothetical protein